MSEENEIFVYSYLLFSLDTAPWVPSFRERFWVNAERSPAFSGAFYYDLARPVVDKKRMVDNTMTKVNANKLPPLPRNYTSATHSSKVLSKINNIRMTAQLSDYIHG